MKKNNSPTPVAPAFTTNPGEAAKAGKKKRIKSPNYPYFDLGTAIEKAKTILDHEAKHAAPPEVLIEHWGYGAKSSTGRSTIAAVRAFGLLEDVGEGEQKQLKLSPLALSILLDDNPESPERADALKRAAMIPRVHRELWDRFGRDLPSDQNLRTFLTVQKNFNPGTASKFIEEYRRTFQFANLGGDATIPGKGDEKPNTHGEPSMPPVTPTSESSSTGAPKSGPPSLSPELLFIDLTFPLFGQRKAILRAPRPLSPSEFDLIEKGLKLFKETLVETPKES